MPDMRKKIKIAVFLGLDLLLLLAALIIASGFRGMLPSQRAAETWRGQSEDRFAQISCFFAASNALTEDTVFFSRRSLDTSLTEASLEAPENGSLWTDAYSASGKLTVSGDKASSEVNATGVGGDFFLFHPLKLIAGSYFDEGNVMDDLVVIDRELAWKLFGATDVCGMTVKIGADSYIIAGVAEREADFASEAAYPGGAGLFMSYSAFSKHLQAGISCYELVLPDPVSGFAYETAESAFPSAVTLQNTGRFGFAKSLELVGQFGRRSMQSGGIDYPYWENAARLLEDYLALLAVITLLLLVYPLILAIYSLTLLFKLIKRRAGALHSAAERYGEKRRTRGYVPDGTESGQNDAGDVGDAASEGGIELDVASIVREVLEGEDWHS